MHTRYVVHNKKQGVFLGVFFGMGFFAKDDDAGQAYATAFESEEDAKAFFNDGDACADWDEWGDLDADRALEVTEVKTSHPDFASIAECRMAGLEPWIPNGKWADSKVFIIRADPPDDELTIEDLPDEKPSLEQIQEWVGGYVQDVPLQGEEEIRLLCDEEGKFKNKPENYAATSIAGQRVVGDVVIMPYDYLE